MRQLTIYYNEELAGILREEDDKSFVFSYDDVYFRDPQMPMISLTLPKSRQHHRSSVLFPFFFNLIAEGANLSLQSRYFKVDKKDFFSILSRTAQYDTIGPVTVKPINK